MKKAFLALLLAGFTTSALAAVSGSSHDLSVARVPGTTTNQTCVFCHAPHNTNTGFTGAPLWNRATPGSTYTAYTSTTINQTPSAPGVNSRTCLSCHDGSADVSTVYNGGTALDYLAGSQPVTGIYNVGTDLRNDHPVGITYPGAVANEFNALPATLPLYTSLIECGTCHDPHVTTNGRFLRLSNSASALCTACHIK